MVVTLVENSLINERWRACYLTKPFNDEELLSYLRIVVPDSRDRQGSQSAKVELTMATSMRLTKPVA